VLDLQPIFTVLRLTDREGSTIGLLHEFMSRMGKVLVKATNLSEQKIVDVRNCWIARWEWFHRPIHDAAKILHPLWRSELGEISPDLYDGWNGYLDMVCTDPREQNSLNDDLLKFLRKEGSFAREASLLREPMLAPVSWWEKFGRHIPKLQSLALKVLSQDCSSSVCERNWSCFNLVQTKKRNRLSFLQLKRLVFVQTNLRMVRTMVAGEGLKELNPDTIDIERVPTLHVREEDNEDHYAFLQDDSPQVAQPVKKSYQRTVRLAEVMTSTPTDGVSDDSSTTSATFEDSDSDTEASCPNNLTEDEPSSDAEKNYVGRRVKPKFATL
jgi:hypothetical protein